MILQSKSIKLLEEANANYSIVLTTANTKLVNVLQNQAKEEF